MSDNASGGGWWLEPEAPVAGPVPRRYAAWFRQRGIPEELWSRELVTLSREGWGRAIETAFAEDEQQDRLARERTVLEARVTRGQREVEEGLARVEARRAEEAAARTERQAAAVRQANEERLLASARASGGPVAGRLRPPIGGRNIFSVSDGAFGRGGDLGMR